MAVCTYTPCLFDDLFALFLDSRHAHCQTFSLLQRVNMFVFLCGLNDSDKALHITLLTSTVQFLTGHIAGQHLHCTALGNTDLLSKIKVEYAR